MMEKADIGLIGLAVMGENLVMNMESKGSTVAVSSAASSSERSRKPMTQIPNCRI